MVKFGFDLKYSKQARRQKLRAKRGGKSALQGFLANIFLAAVKIISGVVGNSYALIADGVESILDVFSSIVVWTGLRIAATPPDKNHHYGHGKAEALAALVVSNALLIAAVGLAIQSVREILAPQHAPAPFTLVVLIAVVITKELLYRSVYQVGEEIDSTAVKSDAWHHRSDMLTSLAAFVGISISLVLGEGYESADDWCALIGCTVIAYNGSKLLRSAIAEIMDEVPSEEISDKIIAVSESIKGVERIETCRVRKSGVSYYVDLHIVVDGNKTVREGHAIAHVVKDEAMRIQPGIYDIMVHVEPAENGV